MRYAALAALKKIPALLAAGRLERGQQLERIESMERNIGLPVRAGVILVLGYYLFFSNWLTDVGTVPEVVLDLVRKLLSGYVIFNLGASAALFFMRQVGWGLTRWVVFTVSLLDGFILTAVVLVSGGYDSGLYWLFLGLIARNAVSVPVATLQIILNLSVCFFYGAMAVVDARVMQPETLSTVVPRLLRESELSDPFFEGFVLRLVLLLMMSACCYGIQVLYDRAKRTEEETQESHLRQEQLHAAGRLAGEIAHQLKNPLAIINNAAFNLQKSLPSPPPKIAQQIEIIREEVGRSDRIISQVMGYAQLAEGKVERVDVVEVMEEAIRQVFPPALQLGVRLERKFEPRLPRLLVQRAQLAAVFVNLLTNARDAAGGHGHVGVRLACTPSETLVITVEDGGPGIAPADLNRIFEAYYTTKEKGSGLGLAIVRHNVELYGGTVHAHSELGKGARFVVEFPTRKLSGPAA
ncbi:MAG: hypothetical protein HY301_09375 [Verrucomicrobia bacterium]|nr:hypothetical protein [Verrucomicrobiota bacterium]